MGNDSRVKYPRTFHLPYSLTVTEDDKRLKDDSQFAGVDVVASIKMDGENSSVYHDGYIHARSLDGNKHPWQAWLKKSVQAWCRDIPDGWRVCGENLYPRHSIPYVFPDESWLFQVFGIYDGENRCLPWDETEQWCEMLGVRHVPVIWRGVYDKDAILGAFEKYKASSENEVEGFVVRASAGFSYGDFKEKVGKYVRANHVTTDEHWTKSWVPNEVKA